MSKTSKKLTIIIICLLVVTFGLLYNKTTITTFLNNLSSIDSTNSSMPQGSNLSEIIGGIEATIFFGVIITGIVIFIKHIFTDFKPSPNAVILDSNDSISDIEFQRYFGKIDMDKFIQDRISDLIQIECLYTNFEYNKLKEKLSDDLYNQYEEKLKYLAINNEKEIMRDFKTRDCMITHIDKTDDKYEVTMELIISFINYVEANDVLVRGYPTVLNIARYELVFDVLASDLIDKCPRCETKLEDTSVEECPYCKHKINHESIRWILSKKILKGKIGYEHYK